MESTLSRIRGHITWVCFYGPVLSFLPERWRGRGFNHKFAMWDTATMISGLAEIFVGVNMFGIWFWLPTSPVVLWISVYFFCDGGWRTIHAKTHGDNAGSVLLVFVDQAIHSGWRGAWEVAHPVVADAATLDDAREDWQLKIQAAQAKKHWEAGKIVRSGERYFRIESTIQTSGSRPFLYLLRSLPAGVPGHGVLNYTPAEIPQKSS
jgi:hypothetical protein